MRMAMVVATVVAVIPAIMVSTEAEGHARAVVVTSIRGAIVIIRIAVIIRIVTTVDDDARTPRMVVIPAVMVPGRFRRSCNSQTGNGERCDGEFLNQFHKIVIQGFSLFPALQPSAGFLEKSRSS